MQFQLYVQFIQNETNNFYTTLMAESEEELKSLLIRVREQSEKNWLETRHSKAWRPSLFMPNADKSLQSCLTLCDPIDGSPPGSPVPGVLHVRTLEWVVISFSNA